MRPGRVVCLATGAALVCAQTALAADAPAPAARAAAKPPVLAPQNLPAEETPAYWVGPVAALVGYLYPPAQTRFYVLSRGDGVTAVLRRVGYALVETKSAKDLASAAPGYLLSWQVEEPAAGGGGMTSKLTVVEVKVGDQTLTCGFVGGRPVGNWSLNLQGASDETLDRAARLGLRVSRSNSGRSGL